MGTVEAALMVRVQTLVAVILGGVILEPAEVDAGLLEDREL